MPSCRTSHQIRRQADRLLPSELSDVDGNSENRYRTISVFNGPEPEIKVFDSEEEETEAVAIRSVAVMACDDELIPLQQRVAAIMDDSDLEEVYNTERRLLYVACTRARDDLMISGVEPASEFLDDL